MANLNVSVWYIDSAQWTAMAGWLALTSYPVGSLIRQTTTPTVGNERAFVQVNPTTHTSGATEPAWSGTAATRYQSFTDATCTWIECTGNPAVNGDLTNALTWTQQHTSSIAVTVGLIIYDSVSASLQIITTAGNLGSSAPTFSATAGTVTSETGAGTAKWTSLGAASGFQYWKAPFARTFNGVLAATWAAAGNTIFIGDDSAETQTTSITVTGGTAAAPYQIYCVDHTAALPPTSSNLKTTATISATGAGTITGSGTFYGYLYGVTLQTASTLGLISGCWRIDSGGLVASGSGAISMPTSGLFELNNSTISPAAGITMRGGIFVWKNTASALGGTLPSNIFNASSSAGGTVILEGVDLSAAGSGKTIVAASADGQRVVLVNCKFNASVTIAAAPLDQSAEVIVISSDSAATTYNNQDYRFSGTLKPSTTVVRTGGASINGTPISWQIATTTNSLWIAPFSGAIAPSTWLQNPTVGSNVAVILYGIWFGSALPNNDQIWHDVEYYGASGSPLASLGSGTKANNLASGSAWAADTSAWDSQATARANSTVYAVGNIFKQSGSPGSLFIVTAIGSSPHQSAASPPAGYTSAADGAVITDGNLTVQAAYRFSMTVNLTSPQPQLAGYLYSYVKAALPSSTFYIDPQIVL